MHTRGMGHHPLGRYYSWPLQHTGFFKSVNLIDHVSLEDRLRIHRYWGFVVGGEYELALEVITSGKVRGLFVSSLVI